LKLATSVYVTSVVIIESYASMAALAAVFQVMNVPSSAADVASSFAVLAVNTFAANPPTALLALVGQPVYL